MAGTEALTLGLTAYLQCRGHQPMAACWRPKQVGGELLRADAIGSYTGWGANVFAAAPPDVRKVFDLPGAMQFFLGLRPRRPAGVGKKSRILPQQAAQPRGAQPLQDRPSPGRSKTFRTSGGAAARKARGNLCRYQWADAAEHFPYNSTARIEKSRQLSCEPPHLWPSDVRSSTPRNNHRQLISSTTPKGEICPS
jgi:hypothetical protein